MPLCKMWAVSNPPVQEMVQEGGTKKRPRQGTAGGEEEKDACLAQAMMPSSLPAWAKAAMARSSCSSVCAAEICVRMRACPLGTTG